MGNDKAQIDLHLTVKFYIPIKNFPSWEINEQNVTNPHGCPEILQLWSNHNMVKYIMKLYTALQ